MILFKQIAKLTTRCRDEVEENRYEYVFEVEPRGDTEKSSVIYDKELKIYFENPAGATYQYEIDITKVRLDLCRRLRKSANFTRKLFYRYDFIQLKVDAQGRFVAILNKSELKDTWSRLKKRMLIDHKGDYVEKYLDRIDFEFADDKKSYPALKQYLFFGLLFPYIPKSHLPNWERKRIIELSPYENEKFEETIRIASIGEKEIVYNISGTTLPDSNTKVVRYEGTITKEKDQIFAKKILINTSIAKNNITSEWEFELYKYKKQE